MLWLKFLHIMGITVWVAGLLYLAAMLLGHSNVRDRQDFARVRMASRFAYMGVISPAAFIAIGAGGALLFISDALHPWMFLKLMAVGILVISHIKYGYVLTHLADEEAEGPTLRIKAIAATILVSATVVLWLVLSKPAISEDAFPDWLMEPGFLERPASPVAAPPPPPRLPQS
ncbi:CopD family protein [Altericroceibacterium xinjiangense]|uniref:CopD family protein n=1 Tax=Altericroceibacterium xinjiangense TaxID=762261 RepID=UPI000F7E6988|nr:CopD family protein [Altericroceibacterium xinjiangense]